MPLTVTSEAAVPGVYKTFQMLGPKWGSRARSVRGCALGGATIRIVLVVR
jgi:hypothetical protein